MEGLGGEDAVQHQADALGQFGEQKDEQNGHQLLEAREQMR